MKSLTEISELKFLLHIFNWTTDGTLANKNKFWLWVDGKKCYYDPPVDPPGYSPEKLEYLEHITRLYASKE